MRHTAILLIAGLACFAVSGAARAEALRFDCVAGDTCAEGKAINKTNVVKKVGIVVSAVSVTQLKSYSCDEVKLRDGTNLQVKESIGMTLNRKCNYKVRFSIKGTCDGDKDIKINADDIANDETVARLVGLCGSLSVKRIKYDKASDS